MKLAYFDCIGGASGDMLLAALMDAGAAEPAVRAAIAALALPGVEVRFERGQKGPFAVTLTTVTPPRAETHRHLKDLLAIVDAAPLSAALKTKAAQILRRLTEVEAQIHNEPVEQVHLHEVGGDDTLVDIVGVLAALETLAVKQIFVSPLPLARGFIQSAHGLLPLPAPATLAQLTNVPVRYVEAVDAELVTPTGAALLTSLADGYGGFPPFTLQKIGVGAGRRDLPFPNVVRVWLGETSATADLNVEQLVWLETNIDDLNPQVYGYVLERLFEAGALDVTLTPVQMKKNRPAVTLAVLCPPAQAEALTRLIFAETPTLGVRRQTLERISLPRSFETVATPYGPIRVKVVHGPRGPRGQPEYEDCRRAAAAHQAPLTEVMRAAQQAYAALSAAPAAE